MDWRRTGKKTFSSVRWAFGGLELRKFSWMGTHTNITDNCTYSRHREFNSGVHVWQAEALAEDDGFSMLAGMTNLAQKWFGHRR